MQEIQHTPFYELHISAKGKLVNFGGFALPINYGSQIKEHECVRQDAGMFDVSHMCIIDIKGTDSKKLMRHLISNDVNKLDKYGVGKALYSGMLNQYAGVIDDLIVYLMPFGYRMVTNAATKIKDLTWINQVATEFKDVTVIEQSNLAMLAVQGPNAINKFIKIMPLQITKELATIKPFMAIAVNELFIARTGYTGESGLEIILPINQAETIWNSLLGVGVAPCGLGARDTLRLEAGMNLYGQDMDETSSPLECGMDWVVDLSDTQRNFIGKEAYLKLKQQDHAIQIGLILTGNGVLRHEQSIICNNQVIGTITSGTFSPTLQKSIAIARLFNKKSLDCINEDAVIYVNIRNKLEPVKLVKLPFVRNGQPLTTI